MKIFSFVFLGISFVYGKNGGHARFESWHVPFRDSYYKAEPDHAAATHNVFVYYMLKGNRNQDKGYQDGDIRMGISG